MVDDRTLVLSPVPDVPTLEIPMMPGDDLPRVEPRRWTPDGPVWDATDEIYIVYDKEGERELVTTGPDDIWNKEHQYQRTGSARYAALRSLGGRAADAGRDLLAKRPRWAGGDTGRYPTVGPDRPGRDSGRGPGRGEGSDSQAGRAGSHGAPRHTRHRGDERRVPERPAEGPRARSHRHCPGCSGHGRTNRSGGELAIRAIVGWFLGWVGIWAGDFGLTLSQYGILTSFLGLIAILWRPVWREIVNSDEHHTKGGRR